MIYVTFPGLFYFIAKVLYVLTTFIHFVHCPPPASGATNLFLVSMSTLSLSLFKDSTSSELYGIRLSVGLISLSMMPRGPSVLSQVAGYPSV